MKRSFFAVLGVGASISYLGKRAYQRRRYSPSESASGARIAISGAGFTDLSAASKIVKLLGPKARICLIDQCDYHLFTPLRRRLNLVLHRRGRTRGNTGEQFVSIHA